MAKRATASSRRAKAGTGKAAKTTKAPAFPKTLVKVTRNPAGGYGVEERIVADAAAENAALEEGFQPLADVLAEPEPQQYPAWRYHKTQGSKIVQSEAEAEKLGAGWSETPISAQAEEE